MEKSSLNRLGALSIGLGPLMALVFFLIQPGGMFIDNTRSDDAVGSIAALASNNGLATFTALGISLGLGLTMFGTRVVQHAIRSGALGSPVDTTSRLGFWLMAIGTVGWILAQGLVLSMADTNLGSEVSVSAMLSVYSVQSGITLVSGLAVSLGFAFFALGVGGSGMYNLLAARVIAVVSLVAFVFFIVAISTTGDSRETSLLVARICYFPWVIWTVGLGAVYFLNKE